MQLLETFPNECPQRYREGYLLGKLDYTLYQERVPLPKEFKIKLDAEVNRGSLMKLYTFIDIRVIIMFCNCIIFSILEKMAVAQIESF